MKPSECIIAFGLPTDEEEFWEAKDDVQRDFVRHCCPVWQVYRADIVAHLEEIGPYYQTLGVKVVQGLKLSSLRGLLTDNSNKVFILFSHWKDDSAEFFDGMASSDAIVNEIPSDFKGIIDLCVCHPTKLAIKIRNHLSPDSLVKFTDITNTPYRWLYFYWAVFTIMDDLDVTYTEALKRAVQAFAEIK
jgi:hypothetical protein